MRAVCAVSGRVAASSSSSSAIATRAAAAAWPVMFSSQRFCCSSNNATATATSHGNAASGKTSSPFPYVVAKSAVGVAVSDISAGRKNDDVASSSVVRLRGRAQAVRVKGKMGFLVLRQPLSDTIQVVVSGAGSAESSAALEILKTVTPESIVDVWGTIVATPKPVASVSCQMFEIAATKVAIVTAAETPLPFPLADNNTKLDTRLDNRIMDLRTPNTGAVARLVSVANNAFKDFMLAQRFFEIHTPKMIGTPSEGGSAVFELEYFGKKAFLAQSPQLYKQMMLMGDAMGVFEIGPVFRAERSLTHRHLTEFVGLDVEMVIHEHYTEVLNVLEGTLVTILRSLENETTLTQLATSAMETKPTPIVALMTPETMEALQIGEYDCGVASQDRYGGYVSKRSGPFPVLRMSFDNAVALMMDQKLLSEPVEDFSTAQEKALGGLIKARYGVDVYVVDHFPKSVRPFYTMPSPLNPNRTCSYDMYLRGEEICSGAQRIHDPKFLQERMRECGVDVALIQDYVNSFRYGAWPHGGFGLGLERIVLFYLGLPDIRMVSLFPRDPKRITP